MHSLHSFDTDIAIELCGTRALTVEMAMAMTRLYNCLYLRQSVNVGRRCSKHMCTGMDERRMSSVQMEGGKYTQFPVAARTPDKITIPDGLAGYHRLQPDHHHVFARLSESLSNVLFRLPSNDSDLQLLMLRNPKAPAGRLRERQEERAARTESKGALKRLKDGLKGIWR